MTDLKLSFKKNFLAGLIIILPLWLTFFVVWLVFRWISGFTVPFLSPLFHYVFGQEDGSLLVRVICFFLTIFIIWFVGLLTTYIAGRRFLGWMEATMIRLPFLSGIYLAARKLIQYVFVHKTEFKRVVMVEFPRAGIRSIGFVTGTCAINGAGNDPFVNVFVPTAPNPTTGYLILVRENDIVPIDISVDEAVRMIISGGIIVPEPKQAPKEAKGTVPADMPAAEEPGTTTANG